jgi:hypothetical protein
MLQYRQRDKKNPTKIVSVNLSLKTIAGLDAIRAAFHRRYPEQKFPTLSGTLEQVLQKNIAYFEREPEQLDCEVQDYENRYPVGTQPSRLDEAPLSGDEGQK